MMNFANLRSFTCLAIFTLVLTACAPAVASASQPTLTPTPVYAPAPDALPPVTPLPPLKVWANPAAPEPLLSWAQSLELPAAASPDDAAVHVDALLPAQGDPAVGWVYALVAAFPTVQDGVAFSDLQAAWAGNGPPLVMTESTYWAMKIVFGGEAGSGAVRTLPADLIVDAVWADRSTWAIVPFEAIQPRVKVLEVAGQSPLRKSFEPDAYPLRVRYTVSCDQPCPLGMEGFPSTNRDPQKLATVVMTGVTALVRATAYTMENKGVLYPGQEIRPWLVEADIAHISNEIPFAQECPFPNPNQRRLIFCSDSKYIDLITDVGADVIELTGNHFQDWGKEATLYTVQLYRDRGLPYFGGGADLADAQKPALLERGGMKFAFLGCNPVGPDFAWARADGWPGAAPCGDYAWIVDSIRRLRADGYIVIATFQYYEYYSADPRPWQMEDFRRLADAGAVVVSGSQAHFSQAMEFYGETFVHYGLGNLFFDQMGYDMPNGTRTTNTRREFLDRHVFYDGKYLGVELLTAMLEDYSRPRPMNMEERAAFLEEYFRASGWLGK